MPKVMNDETRNFNQKVKAKFVNRYFKKEGNEIVPKTGTILSDAAAASVIYYCASSTLSRSQSTIAICAWTLFEMALLPFSPLYKRVRKK